LHFCSGQAQSFSGPHLTSSLGALTRTHSVPTQSHASRLVLVVLVDDVEVLVVLVDVVVLGHAVGVLWQHTPPGHAPPDVRVKQHGGVSPAWHPVLSSTHSAQQLYPGGHSSVVVVEVDEVLVLVVLVDVVVLVLVELEVVVSVDVVDTLVVVGPHSLLQQQWWVLPVFPLQNPSVYSHLSPRLSHWDWGMFL
jgi:hypothetical protein